MRFIYSFLIVFLTTASTEPLPKLFLIGDSISIQYTPYLQKHLKDKVNFERKQDDGLAKMNLDVPMGANGGDSKMVLAYVKSKLKEPDFKPNYLLLNCGLHDIKRNPVTKNIQIDKEEYKNNLTEIFRLLQTNDIQALWIRTTPVVDSIHNKPQMAFFRFNTDVQEYNKIADEICNKNQIPAIDLYGFTQDLGIDQYADHVHFKKSAQAMQASYLAGFVSCFLQSDFH